MDEANIDLFERTLIAAMPTDRKPTEAELHHKAAALRLAFPVDDHEFERVLRVVESRMVIIMELGTALSRPDHAPWLAGRRASIDPFYWDRYRDFLPRLGLTPPVVSKLDQVTDDILDQCGDPTLGGLWTRRGLVVGDVQSGKTATYTALIAKGADAGYRVMILMTGVLENLRRQTQERLDEGFVGLDSSDVLQKTQVTKNRAIGVGLVDNRRVAGVFTSRSPDFSKGLMNHLGFRLDAFQEPVLVVIKKNSRVIDNLRGWLATYNAGDDGKIRAPLLLIDDEADSASINTADAESQPSRINSRVRELLALFHRSTYVGFTATPFANVFVDPDTEDEMLGDDLFPRDFIYALEAPSNYVGPDVVFGEASDHVQANDDAVAWYPPRHKSTHSVGSLPPSLQDAVRSFFLASAIRDLRHERNPHRSMLINVSRFTAVQNNTADIVFEYVRQLQRDIRSFSHLRADEAADNESLAALKDTWRVHYESTGPTWDAVRLQLNESTQPITVRSVNQSSSAASLDYKSYLPAGLRVIAVGGDSLSRGLTLEGLSTSYFFRNSQAYDTLMQMGRWFGYRDGYADLCRLWITEEATHWYAHIASATDELRSEFKRMYSLGLTPNDFGLKVRAHPDSLMVTARNKMRTAKPLIREISLSGNGIETARLLAAEAQLDANADRIAQFIGKLKAAEFQQTESWGSILWRGVPREMIADLLEEFETHPRAYDFQGRPIAQFLRQSLDPVLREWDVALPQGSGGQEQIGGVWLKVPRRGILVPAGESFILVSGSKARVGGRGAERAGLTKDEVAAVEAANPGANLSDKMYRQMRKRPLMLVHVLRGTVGAKKLAFRPAPAKPLTALGLSFPPFDDSGIAGKVKYQVAVRLWQEMFEAEAPDELPNVDDDDD